MQGEVNQSRPDRARVGMCIESVAGYSLARSPAFDSGQFLGNNRTSNISVNAIAV